MTEILTILKSELLVTAIIFLLFFIKLGRGMKNEPMLMLIQVLLLLNFIAAFFFNEYGTLFSGMYHSTPLILLQKSILNLGVYLISLLFGDWFKRTEHLPEFFILMLSALLGMFLLISSGNLLMFFLSLELATIPVAAMANFDLEKKRSSEAAMKMILSSAFASGILLFGISLIYGATGTIQFSEMVQHLKPDNSLQILAFVFLFAAFAFKLSIVPFHLWTADVYEGAPMAATSFLSVISKGSVAFIFMWVLYRVFFPLNAVWYNMVMILAIATMIIGNLFALRQQNIKRFLAFSSIAQVGFILVGISGTPVDGTVAVTYFVLIYVFSNLAAFGVASVIASQTAKENIADYNGMYKNNPFLSWMLTLALFSLAGVPPAAGFFGKLFLLTSGASTGSYFFIGIAALNMIISLYYYLRVVRAVFMEKNEQPIEPLKTDLGVKLGLIICGAGIILVGLLSWIYEHLQTLTEQWQ
ncbi:MAG TPA: NADH-quinone oxidoreductase subunit N [Ferruginibacter sp.]|nr:NADH-quinone oxidoreductase subunit N [Ferruginibacter sp.]HNG63393.1 NADH-quinone oxidoreductase subunit N [Ferruginibacter sp.]HNL64941.1 NADH-quinone oxidoreductase subunit N [Ferruginibacter sp.]